tara:strand:+ start:1194 stop:2123 length:930 start_codon:yes stop_codon:yes gene_type:complete
MAIQFLKTGLQTTVQDLGRAGSRHIGIPQSGCFDYVSSMKANEILGKEINSPVLECTMTGPQFKVLKDIQACVSGAMINQITIDGVKVEQNKVLSLKAGNIFTADVVQENLRFYIAFSKNIQATQFLDSVSTYLPGRLGGINGSKIENDQIIDFEEARQKNSSYQSSGKYPDDLLTSIIRVVKGPEFQLLNNGSSSLESHNFSVSNESNRMGIRTGGDRFSIDDQGLMKSKPIYPGTIQCSNGGQPIIMGADAQTLGGYPRILQVIKADRHLLGQLRPNDNFVFKLVSIPEAIDAWRTLKKANPFICEL